MRKLFGEYADAVPRYVFFYARRYATTGARFPADSPQVQFSDQSFMLVLTPTPVEIPQVQFLDKLFMPVVVSGADGQTAQITVEIPQVPFLDKLFMHVVVSGADGQTAQNTRGYSTCAVPGQFLACPSCGNDRCSFWTRSLTCPLGCYDWRDGPDSAENCQEVHRCIAEQIVVYQHHRSWYFVEVIQLVRVTLKQIVAFSATDHGENVEVIQLYT